MDLDGLLSRSDVPDDAKEALRAGVASAEQRVQDLQRLARAATALAELSPEADPYDLIAETIGELTGGTAIVAVSEVLDGGARYRVRSLTDLGDGLDFIGRTLGLDPRAFQGRLHEPPAEVRRGQGLVHYPGGLHELSRGEVPKAAAEAIERFCGIEATYGLSFVRAGVVHGNVAVFARSAAAVNAPLVEAYAWQATLTLERRQTALRERRLAEGLRTVAELADELVAPESVDDLCRQAVELARERLGLERCSIYLAEGYSLRGTYGTDLQRQTTDERHIVLTERPTATWALGLSEPGARRWSVHHRLRTTPEGQGMVHLPAGWVVQTPIQTSTEALGLLFNDAAISESALDDVQQEVAAVFCSVLATMIRQKRAEEALRGSAREWQTTFDALRDAVLILDRDGLVLRCNRAAVEALGLDVARIVGQPCHHLLHHADARLPDCPAVKTRETRRRSTLELEQGGRRWFVSADPILDASGEVASIVHTMSDITDRKRAEEQLRRSSRLEAVGTLAGGVAHDFNNILTGIIGYAGFLQAEHPESEEVRDIRALADRAAGLTRQLLLFSRRQPAEKVEVSVNDLLAELLKMLVRVIGEDIAVTFTPDPEAGLCLGDPGQVEQVVLNIAANARDAMPEGGELTISTSHLVVGRDRPADAVSLQPGPYIVIAISDTGSGMDAQTRERVFEPFFTTKEVGKGTGLGMAMAYGIIRDHEGDVGIESTPGHGTTVRLYLPQLTGPRPETTPAPVATPAAAGGETILVAEDEASVLAVVARVLSGQGYTVLLAESPQAARAIFAAHAQEISLLLTDVVMPRGSGPALYRSLAAEKPGLRVLFMSGHTDHRAIEHMEQVPAHLFLQKPFTPAVLIQRVRQALDAPSPP